MWLGGQTEFPKCRGGEGVYNVYMAGSAKTCPNCGFNNYTLADVLSAYIILSIFRVFFGSNEP